jgi:hypothetical protein
MSQSLHAAAISGKIDALAALRAAMRLTSHRQTLLAGPKSKIKSNGVGGLRTYISFAASAFNESLVELSSC